MLGRPPPPMTPNFNPRTPRGVRLAAGKLLSINNTFQSTHPARGATYNFKKCIDNTKISIHAPREGCDSPGVPSIMILEIISIHAPREGCD